MFTDMYTDTQQYVYMYSYGIHILTHTQAHAHSLFLSQIPTGPLNTV